MRVSVILTDFMWFYACQRLTQVLNKSKWFFIAVYVNWGLVMIDNIHFQYNSMMYGIMLMSIVYIYEG
jgi:alpha-1,3-glucosyltransferase